MKDRVTVIPEDNMINVDGNIIFFEYESPFPVRVVQWSKGSGQLEFEDINQNIVFSENKYNEYVLPFVTLWEIENNKRNEVMSIEPTLDELRENKLNEVLTKYKEIFSIINSKYPTEEREGWFLQKQEAEKVLKGEESLLLTQWVQERNKGETIEEFANLIMENYIKWTYIYSILTSQQQRMYSEVSNLNNTEEIKIYNVIYNIPNNI